MASEHAGSVRPGRPARHPLTWALLGALTAAALPAQAGDWTLTRGVGVLGLYSDNITLSEEATESDFVVQVSPTLGLQGEGRRIELDLRYTLRGIHYVNNSDRDDIRHDLRARSTAELYEDILFLDLDAGIRQQPRTNRGRIGSDDLNITDNRTETYAVRASPYMVLHHGSFADSRLRLTGDFLEYSSNEDAGSESAQLTYTLTSGRDFARTPWQLSYRRRDVQNDDGEDDTFEAYTARLGYVFNRKWRANASVGYADNRIGRGFGEGQGATWSGGLTWTPNPRTRASFDYGERPYGNTWRFEAQHTSRRSTLSLGYRQSLRSARQDFADATLPGLEDIFSDLTPNISDLTPSVSDLTSDLEDAVTRAVRQRIDAAIPSVDDFIPDLTPGLPDFGGSLLPGLGPGLSGLDVPFEGLTPNLPSTSSGTFLERRLQLRYGLNLPRTSLVAGFSYVERDRGSDPASEDTTITDLTLSRQLGPRTSAQIRGVWRALDATDFDSDEYSVRSSLTRSLGAHLSAAVYYQYSERRTEAPGGDYQENRVAISLSSSWD